MVSIAKKDFLVSDWLNGARIISASTLTEAIKGYLRDENVLPYHEKNSSDVFGIEISDAVRNTVMSAEDPIGQAEALADISGVKFFKKA